MRSLMQLPYLALWFLRAKFLGRRKPLQSVVFVTNGCDSTCRHCVRCMKPEGVALKSFADIARDLDYCHAQGARLLDIEGPHLMHWHDGPHRPADIFRLARQKGFYSISTMIPAAHFAAWQAIQAEVDVLWVSVMSLQDCILFENALPSPVEGKQSTGASLYMVVNARNCHELPAVLSFVNQHPAIRQIAFNFHTPFPGAEHLALSAQQREKAISILIDAKRQRHRIMNSISGLRNMLTLSFTRHCWICNFIYCDGRRSPQCLDTPSSGLCYRCGFSMAGEMNAVFSLRLDTILAGMGGR